jgi:hypothetical protein
VWDLQERERKRILAEAVQIKGLMPLLMKHRNGQRWTKEERAELHAHLRHLSDLSPYLVLVVLPGAPLTLPLLAWWLDRRRQHRKDGPGGAVPTKPS